MRRTLSTKSQGAESVAMTGAKTLAHDFSSVHGSTSSGDDLGGTEVEDSGRRTS